MQIALNVAQIALENGEVPVGAVYVLHPVEDERVDFEKGTILTKAANTTNQFKNATRHAEFTALQQLLQLHPEAIANEGLYLYVTVEPCIMCAYGLLLAGIRNVVFGCSNQRFGGCGSVLPIHQELHQLKCITGILENESIQLLQLFYNQENSNAPVEKERSKVKNVHFSCEIVANTYRSN
uniref:CMP/dCMP-type deaminase domain-containing protein n=1 Tax=Arcella intermedia TaxID=1963864 RepID=A0A6B2LLF3_9EUKA